MVMGRPREFNVDTALDAALRVFWRNGYDGASLTEITRSIGITKPSLYAAFGNKEQLFWKALERYVDGPASYYRRALSQSTARKVVDCLLRDAAEAMTSPNSPPGCLVVQGALGCGGTSKSIKSKLIALRLEAEDELRLRFERAIADNDLLETCSASDLARYILTVLQGMAIQATGGAPRADLKKTADIALRHWPPD